ncbi:MAG: hypothetical protein GX591_17375 [Planctomycetes bacterium]|nr:hypothetical protein [Planctomycetota bacterium]
MSRRTIMMVAVAGVLAMSLTAGADMTWKQCVYVDEKIDNALLTWAPWCTSWKFDRSDMSDIINEGGAYTYNQGTVYDAMGTPCYVKEAWLKVCAYGVEPYEKVYVGMGCEADGKMLGCLNPYEDNVVVTSIPDGDGENFDGQYSCTWFQLDPKWLTTDTFDKFFACVKGFKLCNPSECATIKSACMKVTYAPIPAPPAVVLGGLGLATVGWFKRKFRG